MEVAVLLMVMVLIPCSAREAKGNIYGNLLSHASLCISLSLSLSLSLHNFVLTHFFLSFFLSLFLFSSQTPGSGTRCPVRERCEREGRGEGVGTVLRRLEEFTLDISTD